ncbi:MAG TPA: hypothetical protein VFK68_10860 [Propionibacteriaceae bacterium]|nr:hypothetical protein [Propionibacteriaceae bacterium]
MSAAPVQVPPSPMSLGDVFTATFSVFRRRIGAFIGLTALQQLVMVVALVVPVVLSVLVFVPDIVRNTEPDGWTVLAFVLTAVASFVVALAVGGILSLYFTGMMIGCANEATQQRFPSFHELRRLTRGFVGRFVGVYLLGVVAYLLAAAVVLSPLMVAIVRLGSLEGPQTGQDEAAAALLGSLAVALLLGLVVMALVFVLSVKLAYLTQVCAVERLSGFRALGRAWRLTRGAFWRTFGYLFVFSLLAGAAQQAVSLVLSAVRGFATPVTYRGSSGSQLLDALQGSSMWMMLAAVYVVMLIVSMVVVPLRLIFVTVMYGDQFRRERLGPVDHAFAVTVPPQRYAYPQGGYPQQGSYPVQPGYGGQPAPGSYGQAAFGSQPGPYPHPGPYPQSGAYGVQPGSYGPPPGAYPQPPGTFGQHPYGPQPPYGQG